MSFSKNIKRMVDSSEDMYKEKMSENSNFFTGAKNIAMTEADNLKKIGYNMKKEFDKRAESYRNLGMEMGYLKKLINAYVPKEEVKHFYKEIGVNNTYVDKLKRVMNEYVQKVEGISKLYDEKRRSTNDPIGAIKKRTALMNIEKQIDSYRMEIGQLNTKITEYTDELRGKTNDMRKILEAYQAKKTGHSHSSHAENAVLVGLTSTFGISVLWALTQMRPEEISIGGAFVGGEASPILLTLLTSTVIFLLFFLTHHKLK
jgi:DNA integrity scanning protein DisA with diadenylate cyclase activity